MRQPDEIEPAPRSRRVALTTSLMGAPLMALINLGVFGAWWAIVTHQPSDSLSDANALLFLIGALLVELLGFFFIGVYASARDGKVSTGIDASVWTNLWLLILGTIPAVIVAYVGWQADEKAYQGFAGFTVVNGTLREPSFITYIAQSLLALLILILIFFVLGAVGSTLGGLIGKAIHQRQPRRR